MNTTTHNPSFAERYARAVVRHRWAAIGLSLLLVLVLGAGAARIAFENDYRVFFSKENPQLQAYEALRDIYTKDDNILFAVTTRDGSTVYQAEILEATQWLTREAWTLPFATRVDSLTNYQHSHAEGDDLIVEDLVDDGFTAGSDFARVREIAESEPLLFNRLVSDQEFVTGVNVTLTLPQEDPNEVVDAANAARALQTAFEAAFPEAQLHLTGMVMLDSAFAESAIADMTTLIPLMYAGIFLTMFLLLRSALSTLATVVVVVFSTIVGMGAMGWLGFPMSPPVSTAPTIIMTLAIADSVHLLVTLLQQLRAGRTRHEAIIESMRVNFVPVFLTSLTTVIGFLSMNFSDAPPFRVLGNVVAFGVIGAWVFSVLFLPAFMAVLPLRAGQREVGHWRWFDTLSESLIRRRYLYLGATSAIVLGLGVFIARIELDDQWVEYFDKEMAFRQDSDFAMNNLTGIYTIEYSIEAGESGGISNPEYLHKLDEFAAWYRAQPKVKQVVTISDVMKRLNRNLHGDAADAYALPDERELAAQYLLLYEMSLPYGLDLNNQINVDKSASRFVATVGRMTTSEVRALSDRADAWLAEHAPASFRAVAASPTVMFAHISERNIKSMLLGTGVAIILIAVALGLALRSFRYGGLSLLPNLVPAIAGFGMWGILVGEMGLSLSVVSGMTLGIVVDDTVHFLTKYLRARREHGYGAEDAVRYAFRHVGKAIVVTTVILVVGFLVLSLSTFRLNSWMGQLTAIVIGAALLFDLLFLPSLLLVVDGRRERSRAYARSSLPEDAAAAAAS